MSRFTVADVMTREIVYLPAATTLDEAAQAMRDGHIGDIVMTEGSAVAGFVTDRDIVIRGLAEGRPPKTTTLGDIASRELLIIPETATVAESLHVMRERGIRRLLVCDADRQIIGIVSLHDVAVHPRLAEALAAASDAASPA